MSARVCYLKRADRGDVLAGIRLVGEYTDDSWQAPSNAGGEFEPVEHVRVAADAAGEWVAQALRSSKGSKTIDVACLDVEGSACAWVTAPSEQPTVVSAAYSHLGAEDGGVAIAPAELSTIEPMSSIAAGTGEERRIGLIASPDSVARLFLDELDHRGITVASVCSLWQALARAWDPSGPGGDLVHTRLREDRVVAVEQPTMAVVMIEPSGKLVWTWSRMGEPIAGGSMRLFSNETGCSIAPWDVSRLSGDWLAWSAQTGEAPRRVLIISPDLDQETSTESLSPSAFGKMLGESWHNATIDMAIEEDPLGETLTRLSRIADAGQNAKGGLRSLSRRPVRAHRSAHRWVALSLLAFAGTLATYSFQQYQMAGSLREQLGPIQVRQREVLENATTEAHQQMASEPIEFVLMQLRDAVDTRAANKHDVKDSDRAKPVLAEFLNIALQLHGYEEYDGIEPKLIDLNPTKCKVEFWVPEPEVAYNFLESIAEGSEGIEWDDEPKDAGGTKDLLRSWSITGRFKSNQQD